MKNLFRKLLPYKIRSLLRIMRKGRLNEYSIQNRQFKREKKYVPSDFPYYLSAVTMVKNETDYIAEWIEYHLLVGVQKFYVYDNESTDNLREYLEPYINDQIVEYNYISGIQQQVNAFNDAINKYRYASYWLTFIDIDEFLVPVVAETLPDFLKDFEDAPGIEINQVLYGSSGHQHKTNGLVLERFKDHSLFEYPANRGVKSIVNPRRVFYMSSAHIAEYFNGECSVDTNKNKTILPSLERPALHDKMRRNHYACKSFEEFASRIDLGRASSPGKLSIDEFNNRNRNEIQNDPIMDKYINQIKNNLHKRADNSH